MFDSLTIISGGQTGADRAALDFAIARDIPHGGWCPRGRLAEDGLIPDRYRLEETDSRRYEQRTRQNVLDSDATVVFAIKPQLSGGTALTVEWAERQAKPWLALIREPTSGRPPVDAAEHACQLVRFLRRHQVHSLNVAGPRASQEPEVARFVEEVLGSAFSAWLASFGRSR